MRQRRKGPPGGDGGLRGGQSPGTRRRGRRKLGAHVRGGVGGARGERGRTYGHENNLGTGFPGAHAGSLQNVGNVLEAVLQEVL